MVPLAAGLGADTLQIQHTMFNSPAMVALHNSCLSPATVRKLGLDLAGPSICEGEYYPGRFKAADLPVLQAGLAEIR
jgi:hypothetical protein